MRRAACWLVGIALLAAPACGGGGGGGSSPADAKAVSRAGATTAATRSYDLATSSKLKVPGVKQRVTFRGTGAFDIATHRGKLALDFTPLTPVTGQNLGTMLLVVDGAILYMKFPYLRQVEPTMKPWVKINLEQTARAQGVAAFLQFGQGGDPSQVLEYLRGASDLTKSGSASVRGVSTTHYTGTIDLRKVAKTAPAKDRARVRRGVDRLIEMTGEKTLPFETWLDKQGRVRRIAYRQKFTLQNKTTEVAQKMELFDFGTHVEVHIPSPSDVTDLTGLTTGQGQS